MISKAEISTYQQQATDFYGGSMAEMDDNVALGEGFAKTGLIASLLVGENALLVGPPGGSKTNLAADIYRLVDGVTEVDVAALPPHSATKDTQLIGGEQKQIKELASANGDTHTETIKAFVDPFIRPNTKIVWADEITRMDPRALNALLTLFEKRELRTTAGVTQLDELLMGVAGMNPSEKRHVTYPLAVAMTGRFGVGAMVGLKSGNYLEHMESLAAGAWNYTPENIKPQIVEADLIDMRNYVNNQAKLPADMAMETAHATDKLLTELQVDEHDAEEAWGRPVLRIARLAKGLGLLRRGGSAELEDVTDAVKYRATAMLGGLAVHKSSHQIQSEIDSLVDGIFA